MKYFWISLGVLGALLLFAILMFLFGKAKIRIAASSSNVKVMLVICGIRIWILPIKKGILKKGKKSKLVQEIQLITQENKLKKIAKREAGEYVPNFLEQLQLVFALLKIAQNKVHNKLSIRVKRFRIEVAAPDAAQTAILYGSLVGVCAWFWEWMQATWARVERRPGEMQVYPNYLKTQGSAEIDITLKMNLLKALLVIFDMIDAYKDESKKAEEKAQKKAERKTENEAEKKAEDNTETKTVSKA